MEEIYIYIYIYKICMRQIWLIYSTGNGTRVTRLDVTVLPCCSKKYTKMIIADHIRLTQHCETDKTMKLDYLSIYGKAKFDVNLNA